MKPMNSKLKNILIALPLIVGGYGLGVMCNERTTEKEVELTLSECVQKTKSAELCASMLR